MSVKTYKQEAYSALGRVMETVANIPDDFDEADLDVTNYALEKYLNEDKKVLFASGGLQLPMENEFYSDAIRESGYSILEYVFYLMGLTFLSLEICALHLVFSLSVYSPKRHPKLAREVRFPKNYGIPSSVLPSPRQ